MIQKLIVLKLVVCQWAVPIPSRYDKPYHPSPLIYNNNIRSSCLLQASYSAYPLGLAQSHEILIFLFIQKTSNNVVMLQNFIDAAKLHWCCRSLFSLSTIGLCGVIVLFAKKKNISESNEPLGYPILQDICPLRLCHGGVMPPPKMANISNGILIDPLYQSVGWSRPLLSGPIFDRKQIDQPLSS